MKSLQQIDLDYAKAIHQAEQLEGTARDLDLLANNDFQGCLHKVAAGWKGENSQAYIRKGNKLKSDINKSAAQLRKAANAVRMIAKNTREADINARNIALSSGGGG